MNRKLLNILLIGAVVISSGGFMTSCSKNYDDDISSLKNQVSELATADQLKTQVATLQAAITAAQTTATAAQTAAAAATTSAQLQNAVTTLNNLIAGKANKTSLDSLSNAYKTEVTVLNKALGATVDTASYNNQIKVLSKGVSDLNTLLTKLSSTESSDIAALKTATNDSIAKDNANITALSVLVSGLSTNVTNLTTRIQNLEGEDATVKGALATLQGQFNNLNSATCALIGNVSSMVTSVSLCAANEFDNQIVFKKVTEDGVAFKTADGKTLDAFNNGTHYLKDSILIRVSPTTAMLCKDSISILNSKGYDLVSNGIIKIEDCEPYSELIATRAATTSQSGLWKVVLSLNTNDLSNFYNNVTSIYSGSETRLVDFCVAVKSKITGSSNGDRRVISDYGLTVYGEDCNSANTLQYTMVGTKDNIINIRKYHNNSTNNELMWTANAGSDPTKNVQQDASDERSAIKNYVITSANGKIYINLNEDPYYYYDKQYENYNMENPVKEFYVELDTHTDQTTLKGWNSYNWTGTELNQLQKGNEGYITIPSNVTNDVIGFRIIAVNYDGTLADPDGSAFYVSVGNPKKTNQYGSIDVTPTLNDAKTSYIMTSSISDDKAKIGSSDLTDLTSTASSCEITTESTNPNNSVFDVYFYDSNNNLLCNASNATAVAANASKIAYYKAILTNPANFTDDGTYTQDYMYYDVNGIPIHKVTFTIHKAMPTSGPYSISFKENQNYGTSYYCYLVPNGNQSDWESTGVTQGEMDLNNVFNGQRENNTYDPIKDDPRFQFTFSGAISNPVTYANGGYYLNVEVTKINFDNNTSYSSSVAYDYGQISSTGKDWIKPVVILSGDNKTDVSSFGTVFCDYFDNLITRDYLSNSTVMTWAWSGSVSTITYGQPYTVSLSKIQGNNNLNNLLFDNTLDKFLSENYLQITDVHLTSDGSGLQDEYFKLDPSITLPITNLSSISLSPTKTSIETNPTSNVDSHLFIKVKDCYGKVYTISTLKLSVQHE